MFYNDDGKTHHKLAWGCHENILDRVSCIGVMPNTTEKECSQHGCCFDESREIKCASKSVWKFSEENKDFEPELVVVDGVVVARSLLDASQNLNKIVNNAQNDHNILKKPENSNCDKNSGLTSRSIFSRIIGGKKAKNSDWPFSVALYYKSVDTKGPICGGSILSENFILTAAHCIKHPGYPENYYVLPGKTRVDLNLWKCADRNRGISKKSENSLFEIDCNHLNYDYFEDLNARSVGEIEDDSLGDIDLGMKWEDYSSWNYGGLDYVQDYSNTGDITTADTFKIQEKDIFQAFFIKVHPDYLHASPTYSAFNNFGRAPEFSHF